MLISGSDFQKKKSMVSGNVLFSYVSCVNNGVFLAVMFFFFILIEVTFQSGT